MMQDVLCPVSSVAANDANSRIDVLNRVNRWKLSLIDVARQHYLAFTRTRARATRQSCLHRMQDVVCPVSSVAANDASSRIDVLNRGCLPPRQIDGNHHSSLLQDRPAPSVAQPCSTRSPPPRPWRSSHSTGRRRARARPTPTCSAPSRKCVTRPHSSTRACAPHRQLQRAQPSHGRVHNAQRPTALHHGSRLSLRLILEMREVAGGGAHVLVAAVSHRGQQHAGARCSDDSGGCRVHVGAGTRRESGLFCGRVASLPPDSLPGASPLHPP